MCAWPAVSDSVTPRTVACQTPLSMEFSREEYCSGLPFPSPGDLPNSEIEPGSLASKTRFFTIWTTREAQLAQCWWPKAFFKPSFMMEPHPNQLSHGWTSQVLDHTSGSPLVCRAAPLRTWVWSQGPGNTLIQSQPSASPRSDMCCFWIQGHDF